jgi:hypothetical protein
MSIFISYSSKDSEFAEKLAFELVKNGIKVWIDKWALKAGDSLIDRIQSAIGDSAFLLIILSKNSVASEWCKKELNSALVRELEEKKVVVIPVVMEECQVPLFLREKLYANFKGGFENGILQLLKPLSGLISNHIGRSLEDGFTLDYGAYWKIRNDSYYLQLDKVVRYNERPESTVLLQTYVKGNDAATDHYKKQLKLGLNFLMKDTIISTMSIAEPFANKRILLREDEPWEEKFTLADATTPVQFKIKIRGRLIGSDNGMDMLVNYGSIINTINNGRISKLGSSS